MSEHSISIANLVARYAELIDAGDLDGVADLLANAEISGRGEHIGSGGRDFIVRGRDKIRRMYGRATRLFDDGTPRTKHVITNLIIEVDEQEWTATCRSYFCVLQAAPGEIALQPIIAGRYHDSFSYDSGQWRYSSKRMLPELVGDLSSHLINDRNPSP